MEQAYEIKLPLFEGPLDLLLHLIRENKVDIYDIPIALITRQYLQYIELMKELNLEVAGEFLVMAATLIHIKSRMLLPIEETADTEEPEDPRYELVQRLLAYQAFKEAALGLREREEDWQHAHWRKPAPEEDLGEEEPELSLFDLHLFDLIQAFRRVLDRAPEEVLSITRETLTVKDKMSLVMDALESHEAVRFEDLFEGDVVRSHFVVTFVALLELIRLGLAGVYQEKEFGGIWVMRRVEPAGEPGRPQPTAEAEPETPQETAGPGAEEAAPAVQRSAVGDESPETDS
jgi:segregation and condensation protein A